MPKKETGRNTNRNSLRPDQVAHASGLSSSRRPCASRHNIMKPAATAAAALIAAAGGYEVVNHHNASSGRARTAKSSVEMVQAGHRIRLERLSESDPNHVLQAIPDPNHPGLENVTFRFTEGKNTISALTEEVAPHQLQTDAYSNAMSYNGGSENVQYGQELTVDVDLNTGFIVANPKLPNNEDTYFPAPPQPTG